MREWAVAITLTGISTLIAVILFGLCRLLGAWTWIHAWITGSKEETVKLTKSGHIGANGYMVTSESEVSLQINGRYKHYDNIGNDMKIINETQHHHKPTPPTPPRKFSVASSGGKSSPESELPDNLAFDGNTGAPLKRAVSCDSVASDSSVVLEALDSPQLNGELEIGLEYDRETEDLFVIVNRARDLVGPDPNATVDSYVRVFLLPDKSTNMQTRVQRKTNSPIFKERFLFGVDYRELGQRSVLCYVYANDKYTNTLIGEAEIKLYDLDLRKPHQMWVPIIDSSQKPTDLGDLMFSLSYLPTAERLTVVIVKARSLQWTNGKQSGDPFVKVYLLQNGKKTSKKKTSIKKDERNPIFNEAMIFSVPAHALQNIQLRMSVAEYQPDGKATSIGHVFVGPQCTGKSLSHWNQMMSSLRKPVAMWHPLRK